MPIQLPVCPTFKNQMTPEDPFIDFETIPEETGAGEPFPSKIEMKMFENYVCYNCGTSIRQAVKLAVYQKQETKELGSP